MSAQEKMQIAHDRMNHGDGETTLIDVIAGLNAEQIDTVIQAGTAESRRGGDAYGQGQAVVKDLIASKILVLPQSDADLLTTGIGVDFFMEQVSKRADRIVATMNARTAPRNPLPTTHTGPSIINA